MKSHAPPRGLVLLALLPAAITCWLHLPVADGGLLSDDLALLGNLVEPTPNGSAVR